MTALRGQGKQRERGFSGGSLSRGFTDDRRSAWLIPSIPSTEAGTEMPVETGSEWMDG